MIWIRDIECPYCQSHDDITIAAILKPDLKAELEFVCESCRRRFEVNQKIHEDSQARL